MFHRPLQEATVSQGSPALHPPRPSRCVGGDTAEAEIGPEDKGQELGHRRRLTDRALSPRSRRPCMTYELTIAARSVTHSSEHQSVRDRSEAPLLTAISIAAIEAMTAGQTLTMNLTQTIAKKMNCAADPTTLTTTQRARGPWGSGVAGSKVGSIAAPLFALERERRLLSCKCNYA